MNTLLFHTRMHKMSVLAAEYINCTHRDGVKLFIQLNAGLNAKEITGMYIHIE